jgi:chemotaxis protein methyltransferase CheR
VEDRTGESLLAMIDALATNHTSFLREPDHFDFLRHKVIPNLGGRDTIEIWSAACSTGEEVWTLGMVLDQSVGNRKIRIHASDISNKALAFAHNASYPRERCHGIPSQWLTRYFKPEKPPSTNLTIAPCLRAQAAFRRINLVQSYHWPRAFPVIFCRNVMIYFDRDTQEKVVRQMTEFLEPGGYLFVGHAESLTRVDHKLEYVKPAVYRKPGGEGRWNKSS